MPHKAGQRFCVETLEQNTSIWWFSSSSLHITKVTGGVCQESRCLAPASLILMGVQESVVLTSIPGSWWFSILRTLKEAGNTVVCDCLSSFVRAPGARVPCTGRTLSGPAFGTEQCCLAERVLTGTRQGSLGGRPGYSGRWLLAYYLQVVLMEMPHILQ